MLSLMVVDLVRKISTRVAADNLPSKSVALFHLIDLKQVEIASSPSGFSMFSAGLAAVFRGLLTHSRLTAHPLLSIRAPLSLKYIREGTWSKFEAPSKSGVLELMPSVQSVSYYKTAMPPKICSC